MDGSENFLEGVVCVDQAMTAEALFLKLFSGVNSHYPVLGFHRSALQSQRLFPGMSSAGVQPPNR